MHEVLVEPNILEFNTVVYVLPDNVFLVEGTHIFFLQSNFLNIVKNNASGGTRSMKSNLYSKLVLNLF